MRKISNCSSPGFSIFGEPQFSQYGTPELNIHLCICSSLLGTFGTPHIGASKAHLLGSLQRLAALAAPKGAAQLEYSLLNALEQELETLQNITDQFAPLVSKFRIFFFWEQEKTDLKYTKEYIVDESSAAPMIDNTKIYGISADHRAMVQFDKNTLRAFAQLFPHSKDTARKRRRRSKEGGHMRHRS